MTQNAHGANFFSQECDSDAHDYSMPVTTEEVLPHFMGQEYVCSRGGKKLNRVLSLSENSHVIYVRTHTAD